MANICGELHRLVWRWPRHRFPFDAKTLPKNGIYVLFEQGERGHGGDRIVRVGTHTGADQLPSRLTQHFVQENKDRSIFRKNIGRALLCRDGDPFIAQWELDLTTRKAKDLHARTVDFDKQLAVEKRVTDYIRVNFTFVVLRVEPKVDRLTRESGCLSTVSFCQDCGPTSAWLGNHSPKERIRESGLWNVNELYKARLSREDLDTIELMLK